MTTQDPREAHVAELRVMRDHTSVWGLTARIAALDAAIAALTPAPAEDVARLVEVAQTVASLRGASMDRLFNTLDELIDDADAALSNFSSPAEGRE
jgi:hypothetical protein